VPFTANGDLDRGGLRPLYRFLEAAGVDGVFTAGTTGEFTALDDDDRETVLVEALEVFGPDRIHAHVGAGGVSGASSAFPAPFVDLADALRGGDEQAAADAQDRVKRAVGAVAGADIALIKAGLTLRGPPSGPVRVALDQPSRSQLDTLRSAIEDLT
jgi:dihydrodipicolinate synthase/N-acetylneuraminate lyase